MTETRTDDYDAKGDAYMSGVAESVPKNAPPSDFADPPSGLYIGDAEHTRLAVQAVTTGFRGNVAKAKSNAGVKSKIAAAVRKFYSGDEQKRYLTWLSTGKEPAASMHEMISFDLPPFSFRDESGFPEVKADPSVNLNALTAGDPDPMFITRPVGVVGQTSQNGIVYDETLIEMIDQQIVGKVGRQGHVSEANRSWEFPNDVVIWIGKLRAGDTEFAKGYIYPGTPFSQMARKRKAAGGTLSNSMWGNAAMVDNGDGTRRVADLDLESVDFVPAERASLQALGGQFDLTSEMTGKEKDMAEKGLAEIIASAKPEDVHEAVRLAGHAHKMAEMHMKEGKCAECAGAAVREMLSEAQQKGVAEARMKEMDGKEIYSDLSEAQRKQVVEAHCAEAKMKMVPASEDVSSGMAEMKQATDKRLAEMEAVIKRYERDDFDRSLAAAVDRRLDWKVNTDDGLKKMAALKANLKVQVVAEMVGSTKKDDIEAAANRAWETFKPLAEMTRAALGGPSAIVGNGAASPADSIFDPSTGRYSDEFVKQAAQTYNYRKPL